MATGALLYLSGWKGRIIVTPNARECADFSPAVLQTAWELTARMSPRGTVRVAAVDVSGTILNAYDSTARVAGDVPPSVWAMYLADYAGYRYVVFDLDATGPGGAPAAARDTETVSALLGQHGIQHVVCSSGPTGGRHVWVAVTESVPAALVALLARLVERLCPTLDKSPLSNAATGCVRPPGTPHRDGGSSVVISGDLDSLIHPSTPAEALNDLVRELASHVDLTEDMPAATGGALVDVDGRLYLPGVKRSLSPAVASAMNDPMPVGSNASQVLWSILLGAAAARWRYADIAQHLQSAPGLEHLRTVASGPFRRPRPTHGANSPARVLARQWDKAVRQMAGVRRVGQDPTFEGRAAAVAHLVREIQSRADASAGRWHRGGGPSDRRILDALCVLALEAVTGRLEADVRRLALMVGVGRETARVSLLRLAEDGWISRAAAADGPHGAHWTIDPKQVLHTQMYQERSQADPRPLGAGAADRILLLKALRDRMELHRHDVFTRGTPALGIRIGNLYSRIDESAGSTVEELSGTLGSPADWVRTSLRQLVHDGLVHRVADRWMRTAIDRRDLLAERAGIAGRLEAREDRYSLERIEWAWWRLEYERMTTPGRQRSKRRQLPEQLAFSLGRPWDAYPQYPRVGGRADGRAARAAIVAGLLPQFYPVAA